MLFEVSRVTNDAEHDAALRRLEEIWGATEGVALDELNILAMLVDIYERERWPIDETLDPIDIIMGAMEHAGHSRADLVKILGSASRVSEILSHKRALTLEMIRTISATWGIPLSLLTPSYKLEPNLKPSSALR